MKFHKLLFAFLLFSTVAFGQTFDFAKHISATGQAWPTDVETDAQGNIYVCGFFYGTIDLDPGLGTDSHTSNGADDAFIAKYSPSGQFIWGLAFGSTGTDRCDALAVQQGVGDITVVGQFQGSVLFPGNMQLPSHNSGANIDGFAFTVNSFGQTIGMIRIGGDNGWAMPTDVAYSVPDETTFYVFGTYAGTINADGNGGTTNLTAGALKDCFIARYSTAFNLQWAKSVDGPNGDENSKRMYVKEFGQVYGVGDFDGITDFDPGTGTLNITPHGNQSAFVWKLDGNGDIMWARGFGSTTETRALDVVEAYNGDVVVVGGYEGEGDMDPSAAVSNLPYAAGEDGFINRLSSTGSYVASYQMAGASDNVVNSIAVNAIGNLLISGTFQTDVDTDPSITDAIYNCGSNLDGFIVEFDANMNYLWSQHLQSPSTLNRTHSVCYQPSNRQVVVGDFGGTTNIPATGGATLGPATVNDPYIARFYDITIGVEENKLENSLYFDQVLNLIHINMSSEDGTLRILGMDGQLVRSIQITQGQIVHNAVSGLASGVYIAELLTDTDRNTLKFSLTR